MYKKIFLLLSLCSILLSEDIPNDKKIQGRLNIINGASSECVMHKFYTSSGWSQIKGEIGRNGIDGLYYKKKNNTINELLVSESKWNTARLGRSGKNKVVKQMSQEWLLKTMDKLIKKNPTMPYYTLKKLIEENQYRARLFRLNPKGSSKIQITIYKIKNKGLKAFDEVLDTQLKPIDINRPSNNFEKQIIQAYNECRSKYLRKYLNILSDIDIQRLLKNNYIQKKDIKALLR